MQQHVLQCDTGCRTSAVEHLLVLFAFQGVLQVGVPCASISSGVPYLRPCSPHPSLPMLWQTVKYFGNEKHEAATYDKLLQSEWVDEYVNKWVG